MKLEQPNPSKSIFTMETGAKQSFSYTIFAVDGKLVTRKKDINIKGKISELTNLSELPSGVYFIQVAKDDERISKKLIIKK